MLFEIVTILHCFFQVKMAETNTPVQILNRLLPQNPPGAAAYRRAIPNIDARTHQILHQTADQSPPGIQDVTSYRLPVLNTTTLIDRFVSTLEEQSCVMAQKCYLISLALGNRFVFISDEGCFALWFGHVFRPFDSKKSIEILKKLLRSMWREVYRRILKLFHDALNHIDTAAAVKKGLKKLLSRFQKPAMKKDLDWT